LPEPRTAFQHTRSETHCGIHLEKRGVLVCPGLTGAEGVKPFIRSEFNAPEQESAGIEPIAVESVNSPERLGPPLRAVSPLSL
jgi:hypothetical protein